MRIEVENIAKRYLPEKLAYRLQPVLKMADAVISGDDDNSSTQRMALMVFVVRVTSAVIAFVSQVLLARWLGTFQYGIFVGVWVAVVVIGVIAAIGYPAAIIRLISEYQQKKMPSLVIGSLRASLITACAGSTLVASCGAVFLYFFPQTVESYYIVPIYLAMICLPILSTENVMEGIGRAFDWTFVATVPTFIVRPMGLLTVMAAFILLGFEANAINAMWAGIISSYGAAAIQLYSIIVKLPEKVPLVKPEYRLKEWSIIALPMFFVESFYMMQTSIDIMLVSALRGPEETAVYFASTKILALVHFVYFAVRAASAHRYSTFYHSGDIEGFRQYVQKTVTWTFWPSLLLAIIMSVLGKYFLMLFGSEFVSGTYLIWILALGIVLRSSVGPAEALLAMSGGQNICAGIYAVSLIVNIVLNVSLIPVLGLAGAAIATTCALAIESAALHVMAKRKLGIHAFIIPELKPVSGGAA